MVSTDMLSKSCSSGDGLSFLPVRFVVLVFGSGVTLAAPRLHVFGGGRGWNVMLIEKLA